MSAPILLVVFLTLSANSVTGNSCGGLLEGETGHFSLPAESNQEESGALNSPCLWIIQLHYLSSVRFTLHQLNEHSHLNLYSEDQLTACIASKYTKLNATQVGSSVEFTGKTLIVILPNTPSSVAFSWEFFSIEDDHNRTGTMKNSDYVSSSSGLLQWQQLQPEERVTWAINTFDPINIQWNLDVATACGAIESCACVYFAIFQLTSEGVLGEAMRTCGQSSEGKLEGLRGRVVVLIKVNTQVEANKIAVSWELGEVTVTKPPITEPPVTTPPEPTATGLFAATTTGLLALNLQTLEATALTSGHTLAVAVNHKLEKVYWSEGYSNSSIMRSNLDGSAKEIIIPEAGASIFMLAIDESCGNVYFGLASSHEITVCNALGENCAAVISNSSLVNDPNGIALDPEQGVMYWGNRGSSPHSLICANLDGSNATIISAGFTELRGITLDGTKNDLLYWADWGDNTIGTIVVNGSYKRTLVELEGNTQPYGIQVDAHKIYFTGLNRNLLSVDRYGGKDLATIFNFPAVVRHIALTSSPVKQS